MSGQQAIDYAEPSAITAIDRGLAKHLDELPESAHALCRVAQSLVVSPASAPAVGITEDRQAEKSIRRASELISRLVALDRTPLYEIRSPEHRVVGTWRHFALLS